MAGAEIFPALKSDTGELFAGCEKLDLVCIFNGRGGQIRTDDPLLPKRKTLFLRKLDFGSSGESIEGKGLAVLHRLAMLTISARKHSPLLQLGQIRHRSVKLSGIYK